MLVYYEAIVSSAKVKEKPGIRKVECRRDEEDDSFDHTSLISKTQVE
jgi:hypothetical protein